MTKRGPAIGNSSPAQVLHNIGQRLRRMRHELAQMMQQVDDAYTVLENGYIHGTWFCGRPTTKYYGSFPKSFWPRAKHVLRPWGSMVHWFSGLIPPEPGITTVDGNPETNPSVVSVGPVLPFADRTFDASFADPPYSPEDSKRYGLPYISAPKILGELARVTKIGGKIGLLHEFIPPTKRLPVKLLGIIGVMNGPQKRIRLFAIYRKTEHQVEFPTPEQTK